MKRLLLLLAVCISSISFSQSNSKMDPYLAQKLEDYVVKKSNAGLMLPMLIKGNIGAIKSLVNQHGGVFKYSYGNIAAILIPVSALPVFNETVAITRMEGAPPHNRPLDDTANVRNHIIQVLQGIGPLPQAYNGKGVVLGFVDTGIDFKHEDFRDSSGTRVQYYWDMNQPIGVFTPLPWGYGQAWTKAEIDLNLASDSASCLEFGHGSNVAGCAASNGKCNGLELGGCPKSDIVFVAYNFTTQTATEFTDAVQYIYRCADSLNEPCVINASMGSYDGSHDDSDLQGEMIDSMIAAKQPGRMFVTAAGNEGVPYHVHDSLKNGDTTFTWFEYDGGIGIADIPIFANENNFSNLKFRIRCDKVQPGSYTERDTFTVFSGIKDYLGTKTINVFNKSGQPLGQIKSYESVYGNGSYSLEFEITPDSTGYYWGFEATDTGTTFGRYDIWDLGSINGVIDTVGLSISPGKYPEIKKYKQPDTLMTICSSYQCSPSVITVQTYFDRKTFRNCVDSTTTNTNPKDIPGAFNWATSKGPTRNFINMKPDVSAPGDVILSSLPLCFTVCSGGSDSLGCHNEDGGTSMASPMVASAAALYLQRFPTAYSWIVKGCIISTTYTDAFTGPSSTLPNYNWGWGKLDAFDALTKCISDVPTVTNSITFKLTAYPNPFNNTTTIGYDFSGIKQQFSKADIIVYDMIGKMVKTINLNSNSGTVTMDRANLSSGIYFYSLVVDGARLKTEKLDVL